MGNLAGESKVKNSFPNLAIDAMLGIKAPSRQLIFALWPSRVTNEGLLRRFPVKVTIAELDQMGDYTVAIWATIGLVVVFTVPVVWQFMQPNDDDFGDLTKRRK